METTTFDGITRTLGRPLTRRAALRGLVASAAAAIAGGALLHADDASAKRRRKKSRKTQNGGNTQTLLPGAFCQSNAQCNAAAHYICEVPVNAGNSDKTCSGGPGALCGAPNGDGDDTAPFCAVGHRCVFNVNAGNTYTCQAVPDEI